MRLITDFSGFTRELGINYLVGAKRMWRVFKQIAHEGFRRDGEDHQDLPEVTLEAGPWDNPRAFTMDREGYQGMDEDGKVTST